ncbi:MAG: hypothetical protein RLY71_4337 [Pseudomonadota bacterium]|jgi:hypothetical protein
MTRYSLLFILSATLLSACGQNGFLARTGQTCEKLPPSAERIACEQKVKASLAAAEKQRAQEQAEARKLEDAPGVASDRAKKLCFTRQSTGELVCPN